MTDEQRQERQIRRIGLRGMGITVAVVAAASWIAPIMLAPGDPAGVARITDWIVVAIGCGGMSAMTVAVLEPNGRAGQSSSLAWQTALFAVLCGPMLAAYGLLVAAAIEMAVRFLASRAL